jgi:hypothetical protein
MENHGDILRDGLAAAPKELGEGRVDKAERMSAELLLTKPCDIASTNGGHCLTVRTSCPCVSENAVRGIVLSQSGRA